VLGDEGGDLVESWGGHPGSLLESDGLAVDG
jgi:hypothetical protein